MQTVDYQQILDWQAQGKPVLCIDIREATSHKFLPIAGGMKIPFNKTKDNHTLLLPYREYFTVICGMNDGSRCNRVKIAGQALTKMGFTHVYRLSGGLMEGWLKPTQRKKQLPGPTNPPTAF